ncbi:MAG TPA: DinB family protein [Blastocatellia bacterium]|nr:DinB family protein [Blastocatellia bacterium]HMV82426.1 DinB family protein [Blastocatellia bacterium]HMZ18032.1 DinB family protein [Blastocatellia bacterium]HNG31155.1 DinB family protein [Blastocatellia bacterium]
MKFHSIADILAAQQRAQDRFAAAVAGLTEAQAHFRPAENEWTIAEIAEHVGIVNGGMLRITHKLLKQAEAEPKPAPEDLQLDYTFTQGDAPPKFQAPESVHPKGNASIPEALASMTATLAGFAEIQSRLEAVDLSEKLFPHPALGPISACRWMILMSEHQDLHRRQIERVKAAAGFPA